MAVAFGSGVASGPTTATSWTQSLTTSGNNRAVFAFSREPSGAGPPASNVTSVAYNGTNLTRIQDRVGAGNRHASSFGSTNFEPTSGANNIVWTFVGATSSGEVHFALSNVDQTTRYTASAFSGADSGTAISTSITVASGGMAVDAAWSAQLVSLVVNGSATSLGGSATEVAGTILYNGSYLANATAMAWTAGSSAQYVHLVIAVKPAVDASTITPADGVATTSTVAGASTAASTPTPADGAATAATLAGAATAASAITGANGAATAGTLAGSSIVAADITPADGVASEGTLVGEALAAGVASIIPAAGEATGGTLVGSDATPAAPDTSLGGKRPKRTRGIRWQDYDVPLPEPAKLPVPPEAKLTPDPQAPASKLAPGSVLAKPRKAKATTPPTAATLPPPPPAAAEPASVALAPAPEPVAAQAPEPPAPKRRPMMLSDILAAEDMTPEQTLEAMKTLARLLAGPGLKREPLRRLIRG